MSIAKKLEDFHVAPQGFHMEKQAKGAKIVALGEVGEIDHNKKE